MNQCSDTELWYQFWNVAFSFRMLHYSNRLRLFNLLLISVLQWSKICKIIRNQIIVCIWFFRTIDSRTYIFVKNCLKQLLQQMDDSIIIIVCSIMEFETFCIYSLTLRTCTIILKCKITILDILVHIIIILFKNKSNPNTLVEQHSCQKNIFWCSAKFQCAF